jgi:hypothetical protein
MAWYSSSPMLSLWSALSYIASLDELLPATVSRKPRGGRVSQPLSCLSWRDRGVKDTIRMPAKLRPSSGIFLLRFVAQFHGTITFGQTVTENDPVLFRTMTRESTGSMLSLCAAGVGMEGASNMSGGGQME